MTKGDKHQKTRKRNIAYRTAWALRKIRRYRPQNLLQTSELGMVLVHHSDGAFRKSYRIAGTDLLMKFPMTADRIHAEDAWGYRVDRQHTRNEVRKILKLRQFKCLRAHLPPVYYFDSKAGIMVTKFYRERPQWEVDNATVRVLSKIIKEYTGVVLEDLGGDNGKVSHDNLIFVDLGY